MNIHKLLPLVFLLYPWFVQGQPSVDLEWDPPISSAPAGYRLHYGPASGNYTNHIDVGLVTSTRVCCLVPGALYYFAATAYTSSGVESRPSVEFVYKVPDPNALVLSAVKDVALLPNTSGSVPFTVGLGRTALSNLVVSAVSSDTRFLPNSSIVISGAGTNLIASVSPAFGAVGSATVTITATDRADVTRTCSEPFTVSIASVSTASTMNAIANRSIAEDSPIQTVTLSGISSPLTASGGSLRVTASSGNPALIPNPTVNYSSPSATGTLTFTSVSNAVGMATITVFLKDAATGAALLTRTFNVTVSEVNDAPTIKGLAGLSLLMNAPKQVVSLSGIGSGAPNEQQVLTVTATSSNPAIIPQPTVSYVSPSPSATVSFTPAPNATGAATITVKVNDGQATNNVAERSFVVSVFASGASEIAPSFDSLPDRSLAEDSGVQTVTLSHISSAGGNSDARLTAISSNPLLIPHPKINYAAPNTSGSLSFAPVPNATGTATIWVTLDDGQGTATSLAVRSFNVLVWEVNDVPSFTPLTNLTLVLNSGPQSIPLTGISAGPANEAQPLTFSATTSDPSLITDLAVIYEESSRTGVLTFTPAPWRVGAATVTVTLDDGQHFNNRFSQRFEVRIDGNLGDPSIEPISDVDLSEDASLQTVVFRYGPGDILADGARLSATSSDPALIPNPVAITLISNGIAMLSFSPVTNANGQAVITVSLDDGLGGPNSVASQSFQVTVNEVNDPPTMNLLSNRTITQDSPVHTITLHSITAGPSNELERVTINAVSSNPSCIPNPEVRYSAGGNSGTLVLTPVPGTEGSSTITVTVNDGQTTNNLLTRIFHVKVEPPAGIPTLDPIANLKLLEDAGVQTIELTGITTPYRSPESTVMVSATSSNPSLIPPPTVIYTNGQMTGRLIFSPASNAVGLASISVTVQDSVNLTNIVVRTFTVSVWNLEQSLTFDPITPVVVREDSGPQIVSLDGVWAGDTGQGAFLTFQATSGNPSLIPHPTVVYEQGAATASLMFTPNQDMSGSSLITVTLSDGPNAHRVIRSFLVTVLPENDVPTLAPVADRTIDEDSSAYAVSLSGLGAGASDETEPLVIFATSSDPSLIPDPTVIYDQGSTTGTLLFAPAPNAYGEATIQITVSDGQAVNSVTTRSFKVTVQPVEDPATLDFLPDLVLEEDALALEVDLTGITGGPDNETNTLTVTAWSSDPAVVADPQVSYFQGDGIGSLLLRPESQVSGVVLITVSVSDGSDPTNNAVRVFQVTVNPVNDPPGLDVVRDLSLYADAGPVVVPLSGIHRGAPNEADLMVIRAVSSDPSILADPAVEYVSPDRSGSLRLTPFPDRSGVVEITVVVDDGQPSFNQTQRTFTVSVLPAPTNSIFLEAEGGLVTEPMVVGSDTNASNGAFVYAPLAEQGELALLVDIPRAGGYTVWARVQPPDGATQLLHFSLDGAPELTCITTNLTEPAVLHWIRLGDDEGGGPRPFHLSQGLHELRFRALETNVLFDAMYLTTDPLAYPPDSPGSDLTGEGVESIPPYPWLALDIGSPAFPGVARFVDGTFKIRGAGQIGGAADSFHFVHQDLDGDGVIAARLSSANGSGGVERIGLMIRQDLGDQSAYLFLGTSGNGDLILQGRDASGTELPARSWSLSEPPAIWIQLSREGDTFYAFAQVDGIAWQLLATLNLPLNSGLHFGMAVASEQPQDPGIPTFSGVMVEP